MTHARSLVIHRQSSCGRSRHALCLDEGERAAQRVAPRDHAQPRGREHRRHALVPEAPLARGGHGVGGGVLVRAQRLKAGAGVLQQKHPPAQHASGDKRRERCFSKRFGTKGKAQAKAQQSGIALLFSRDPGRER